MEVVHGFVCRDCTDIDLAKKDIDPAHPRDGPFRRDAPEKVREREHAKEVEQAKQAGKPGEVRDGNGDVATNSGEPRALPLATSGSIGTKVNVYA